MGLKKEIVKCDLNGNEVCRYESVRDASKYEGISEHKIYKNVNGKTKKVGDFIFKKTGSFSNKVEKTYDGKFKCPYCNKAFKTYNGLSKHVLQFKQHGNKTAEELLSDYKYNGNRPRCECGCGEFTSIDTKNGYTFCRYVYGHGIRVHNNWGHNETAKAKSADTRRKQYLNGEREQWNKGKKWEETYPKEMVDRLSNNLVEKIKNRVEAQDFKLSSSAETRFVQEFIAPLNVEYKVQYFLPEIKQFCDVYIESKNLIIEFDGDFWHSNPEIYKNGPVYESQKIREERDRIKNEYCKKENIRILRIWENDAKNNKEKVKKMISDFILNK